MNYLDRITELNFDTDNEESQIEAKEIYKKLKFQFKLSIIISSIILLLALIAFILLVIYALKGTPELILYSIIPVAIMFGAFLGILFGLSRNNLAKEIIIENKNE